MWWVSLDSYVERDNKQCFVLQQNKYQVVLWVIKFRGGFFCVLTIYKVSKLCLFTGTKRYEYTRVIFNSLWTANLLCTFICHKDGLKSCWHTSVHSCRGYAYNKWQSVIPLFSLVAYWEMSVNTASANCCVHMLNIYLIINLGFDLNGEKTNREKLQKTEHFSQKIHL